MPLSAFKEVKQVLSLLSPYLRLKKVLSGLVLKLIEEHPKKMTAEHLMRLSSLVDETSRFNYSKKRTNTSQTITAFLKNTSLFPVETGV